MADITKLIFGGGREIPLPEMLDAREKRVLCRDEFLARFSRPLICFTTNIPGPIKCSDTITRAFDEGCHRLEEILSNNHYPIAGKKILRPASGCTAFYAVNTDALTLKKLCVWLEDNHPLGRLFDLDVIDRDKVHISRTQLGLGERDCIVCGMPGRSCAASRAHPVTQLQSCVAHILYEYFLEKDTRHITSLATQSLRYEASTTPKPGLVDLDNNGSHPDMDIYKLMRSVSVLAGYFRRFFEIGVETAKESESFTFLQLRQVGLDAEKAMLEATGGVNTHKGAIFLLGTICGACGRLWTPAGLRRGSEEISLLCSKMSSCILQDELSNISTDARLSFGEELYISHGIKGARGQLMDAFPEVRAIALPMLRRLTAAGRDLCDAGAITLLYLIAEVRDTCLIRRGGLRRQAEAAREMKHLLAEHPIPSVDMIQELDEKFTRENLSPGGCADLLAVAYFLYLIEEGCR